MRIPSLFPALVALALSPALSSPAADNFALGKPVIDFSNQFSTPPAGTSFAAQNVTDGSTTDVFGSNYWLTDDNQGTGAFFTIDLGGPLAVTGVGLRNTHNANFEDRGTAGFSLYAANAVDAANKLVLPQLILTGSLTDFHDQPADATIPTDLFTSADGLTAGSFRYLEFVVDTLPGYASDHRSAGLNEFEVYAAEVPEPSSAFLLGGGLLTALLFVLRRLGGRRDRACRGRPTVTLGFWWRTAREVPGARRPFPRF